MALTYIYNPFTGNLDAIDQATGSPNTVAGFDGSGNIQSIPLWNVNTATGGLYQNLFVSDSVNPGGPTTSVINNFQTTTSPSAPVPNLGYLNLQNHGWIAGDDILGYMGFSNTIDGGGTGARGAVVGLRNYINMGTSVEASTIDSIQSLLNSISLKDLQTVTGNVDILANGFTLEAGSVVSGSVLGYRMAGQVDATASTGDIALMDMSLGFDGTLTSGNIRMGQMNSTVTSSLPGGSGLIGWTNSYTMSGAAQFVQGIGVGHNLQSGASISQVTDGFSENNQVLSGATVNNLIGFSSGTTVQAGGTSTGGYEGFKASPGFYGTMTGTGANSFVSTAQMATAMNYYAGFLDQSNVQSGGNIANTFSSFTSYAQVQSGGAITDFTMFQGSPSIQSGSTVFSYSGFRNNVLIDSNLSTATLVDLNSYGSGSIGTLTGVKVNLSSSVSSTQKIGLEINDGKINSNSSYLTDSLPASPGFISLNSIGGVFHVKPGNPTSNTLVFGFGSGATSIFEDDMGPDAFGGFLGYIGLASVNQVAVETAKTVDTYTAAAIGASVPDLSGQGITGGGDITNANILTVTGILNAGASVAITNLKGINIPSFFNGFSATNAWGLYVADSTVDNWFAKDVVIGGSTGKPIGSERLTVNGSMALAGATSGQVTVAAAATTTSYSLVMPNAQGAASTVLTNDGAGNLSWAAGGGGPTYTSFSFSNNQATPANVTGFSVNSATNNGFAVDFSILRQMSNVPPVGDIDTTFNSNLGTGFNSAVQALAIISSDSSIVAGGAFTDFNGTSINRIVKLDKNGFEDTTFTTNIGTGFDDTVRAVAVDSTNRILIAGSFSNFNGNTRRKLACVDSTGVEDATFASNVTTQFPSPAGQSITSIAIQSDDAIVVTGNFPSFNGGSPAYLVRLNSDGTEDTTFSGNIGTGLGASGVVVAIQPSDQKILVGGNFTTLNGSSVAARMIRLNTDGTLDTSFDTNLGTGFDAAVSAILVQADGKIVVSGNFANFNGNSRNYIVRLNSDGTEDTTFYTNLDTGFDNPVYALLEQAGDNKIMVGGSFTDFNGNGIGKVARLNSDGTEDTAFSAVLGATPTGIVADRTIAAKPSGAVLIGGTLTVFEGVTTTRLVQLNVVEELNQTGTFYGAYSNANAAWKISDPIGAFDDAGVEFSITAGGQLQYISSNMLGTSVTQDLRWMIRGL